MYVPTIHTSPNVSTLTDDLSAHTEQTFLSWLFMPGCPGECASTWSSGRQMSIREWDIPYEELKILDKIGSGRFSTVMIIFMGV